MNKITTKQLDDTLALVFAMPANTSYLHLLRTIEMVNVKIAYIDFGIFPPPMDAVQHQIFDECRFEALSMGLEK